VPSYTIHVNGEPRTVEADARTPLLWVLRDHIGLPGTKFSCGIGLCGSCRVLVDGAALPSCTLPVSSLGDKRVTTIEGLSTELQKRVQQAWLDEQVSQCGYCQPGQIITAVSLLSQNPRPSDGEIADAMSGALCRCGTYLRIRNAIRRVAGGE
jgi:aerobic-type carbon monoxide dehydrogenase small subunit (CoxS/CutS family)